MDEHALTCANCAVGNCGNLQKTFPAFCPTVKLSKEAVEKVKKRYLRSPADKKMSLTSAELESDFYCRITRAEEVIIFARRMGYKKVGVATCVGLLHECNQFARIAKAKGLDIYGVACKVGAIDKTEIGLPEERKLSPGNHESMCNPILQAELLNEQGTELNIVIGLCVGHDSLFIKHSKAPVTYLVVKDRVLCHNPAGALYGLDGYYKKLLSPDMPEPRA
jgi:uncharacterized metal-binding protein